MYRKEGWTQVNPLEPEDFAEIAADFCSRHSFDKAPVAPRTGTGTGAGTGAGSGANKGSDGNKESADSKMEAMTEEQQLQAAIRASMNDAAQNDDESLEYAMDDPDDDDDDDSINEVQIDDSARGAAAAAVPVVEEKAPTFTDEVVAMEVGDEPTDNAARVMIRMPDGKRLVRKFKLDDTVKIIYAFVAQSNDDAKGGKEFMMKAGFPPKDLMASVDASIASTGLAGDSITVRWMED